jgi:hypothetical protein
MEKEKPFGWRPFAGEYRAKLLETFSEEQVAEMETTNAYVPNAVSIQALELASAVLTVAAETIGVDFARKVREECARRADFLSAATDVESQVEAPIVAGIGEWTEFWERLGLTS